MPRPFQRPTRLKRHLVRLYRPAMAVVLTVALLKSPILFVLILLGLAVVWIARQKVPEDFKNWH